ncbi:MAG TPA: outer membrane protein assembly factor BamD [Chromatiales bacterium]|nr:outer membrane protein assembly factor BamD [Chromatiales bacterium]
MRPTNIVYCFVTALSLLLAGCATTGEHHAEQQQASQRTAASTLYSAGKEALSIGNQAGAIRHFNVLITQYPADKFAQQGELELAYAYHKSGQTSAAIATTERFIATYPQHKNIDYAYYLRGLTASEAALAKFDHGTDSTPYEAPMAIEFLNELINRFPDGKYSEDTAQRIDTLNERIAQQRLFSAKQQLDQNNPASAALLAKSVMEEYPQSSAIQEAAVITNQAYQMLELSDATEPPAAVAQTPTTTSGPEQPAATITQPSATADNMMPPSNTIRETSWVIAQPPERFTIQLLGTENEALLRHQIKSNGLLNEVAYYKKLREGAPWYSLIYGSYHSREAATAAAQALPPALRKGKPWIRKIGDIQASLSE